MTTPATPFGATPLPPTTPCEAAKALAEALTSRGISHAYQGGDSDAFDITLPDGRKVTVACFPHTA